jgi:putative transposase
MAILKAYKYRLYPNNDQVNYLNQVFGSARFVWNQLVANFNSWSKDGPNRPMNEAILKNNPEYDWLNKSISYALQQKRIDFDETKKQFFSKNRKTKLGRMKFKKKGISQDSFRIPGQALGYNKCIDFDQGTLKIPKMKSIKIIIDRKFNGQLRSITLSKNKCDQYFVSVLVEEELELKQNTNRSIGIDLGINSLMTLSNGIKISNPRLFEENQFKLKRAQQHLSHKQKGSNRYNQQRKKVAKIHLKIANRRSNLQHQISNWLVNEYDVICMENLNVSGMKKGTCAKSISDVSFAELLRQIEYKCNWYGKTFHKIDRFFPSSKNCSCCGYKNVNLQRGDKDWTCPSCNAYHDRDLNAAINILNEGLNNLYDLTSAELVDYRHREAIRPEAVSLPKASSLKCLMNL